MKNSKIVFDKNLIKEFQLYKWPKSNGTLNDKELPLKLNDHALDALRYMIYSTQSSSSAIPIPSPLATKSPGIPGNLGIKPPRNRNRTAIPGL